MIAAWFISDLHLKDINERSGNVLLRFLLSLERRERPVSHVFLLGDIFDLWVGDSSYFYEKYRPIVDCLTRMKRQGIEIHYFEGNHDVHVVQFWEGRFNIPVWTDAKYFQLGDKLLRLEHGDLINPEDKKYLKYRAFVRQDYMERLAQVLPGRLLDFIGDRASRKSRKHSSRYREDRENELRQMIRRHAERSLKEAPFDVIITGHMHIVDDYEFEVAGRKARSLNLGSWFEGPKALSLIQGHFEWVHLS